VTFMDGVSDTRVTSERQTTQGPLRFEDFFRREHLRLLRALYLVTGSRHEAEEVAQESLVRVWERWERVSAMDDPTAYLYRTAMNVFRSRYRRAVRAARRMVRANVPRDVIGDTDERDAVLRALATLSPRQRAALVLTEMLGYGSEEAGRALGIKPVTVRVLASQGRAALRERLGRSGE
jgi:RNA polymerase sigma-70 factor, ECF subfamily